MRHLLKQVLTAVTVGSLLTLMPATTAEATTAEATTAASPLVVSIRVELDLPNGGSDGPRVFEVSGVTAGPQVELTAANETGNPSNWCGDLAVDVDPVARTVEVGPGEDVCDFQTVRVQITGSSLSSLDYRTGTLFDQSEPAPFSRTIAAVSGGFDVRWALADPVGSTDTSGTETFAFVTTACTSARTRLAADQGTATAATTKAGQAAKKVKAAKRKVRAAEPGTDAKAKAKRKLKKARAALVRALDARSKADAKVRSDRSVVTSECG